jgi:hypothetical protein
MWLKLGYCAGLLPAFNGSQNDFAIFTIVDKNAVEETCNEDKRTQAIFDLKLLSSIDDVSKNVQFVQMVQSKLVCFNFRFVVPAFE